MSDAAAGPTEPELLKVQWLEEGLLVHGVTVALDRPEASSIHGLAAGALAGILGGLAAAAGGWPVVGAALGVAGSACAVGLGRLGLVLARTVPAPPRRLLLELGRDRVSWTSLAGDRWSMQHDHQARLADVLGATPRTTPEGATLRVEFRGAAPWDVPLHGLPEGDARWLADRILEAAAAATTTPSTETAP